ncbi:phosphoenolpyruvate--protein phosphotransferase [Shewanella sp. AS16]|uniref:phosphoenolpyruvate--protein phosphotransferase n=1 Tax=Shewanella sp. AS16 TaxID=2907625 RepID=UPI002DD446F3|nr:phosphoenolpyruvate--protein phosphotransferase [Shewanella sp. AS16]
MPVSPTPEYSAAGNAVSGISVSPGIGFGQALHLNHAEHRLDYRPLSAARIPLHRAKFTKALELLKHQLRSGQALLSEDCDNYQLIDADLLLLEDEELISQIDDAICRLRFSASVAVEHIFARQASELESLDDPYLANRALDVRCLSRRLVAAINGRLGWDLSGLNKPSIILAEDLTPAEFAMLPLQHLEGIVLKTGGLNSHTAILARAAGIPALLNCQFEMERVPDGCDLILDALAGSLYIAPDAAQRTQLLAKNKLETERRRALESFKDKPTLTRDGHWVALLANVGNLNDITQVAAAGADGIGLFRTEFMLMNAQSLPDEKAQYSLYCDALHALQGKIFTIRTLDIGADKELPCLQLPQEDNPALGLRGIRYALAHPELLTTQLRAILRAANHGPIRLMFPMVNQLEELEQVFKLLEDCKTALNEEEKGYGDLSFGIVVETPAAVLNLPSMLPLLDFVSIGTNDLTQYAMAADRSNPQLSRDFPALSPAVLKLIQMTITAAKQAKVTVSLCGEFGSDPAIVPLLIGMGLDELSINLSSLLEVKSTLCNGRFCDFRALAQSALSMDRIDTLKQCITSYK